MLIYNKERCKYMKSLEQSFVRMYCPNCANKLVGYADEIGLFKTRCGYCGVIITSSQKRVRKEQIIMVKKN